MVQHIRIPKVSVLIANYNQGKYLREAVKSLEDQTFTDWELILVDDGSSDDSWPIIEDIAQHLKGAVKVFRHSVNQGVSSARNRAFAASCGQYIAFLDADDRWFPEKLSRQVALIEASMGHIDIVHTGVEVSADLEMQGWLNNAALRVTSIDDWDIGWNHAPVEMFRKSNGNYFKIFCFGNPTCFSSYLLRREVMEKVGGFSEGLFYQTEDWVLLLKASLFFKFQFLPERLTFYRIHSQSYTVRNFIQLDYSHSFGASQVIDRVLTFARAQGLSLSYRDFRPPQTIKDRLCSYLKKVGVLAGNILSWMAYVLKRVRDLKMLQICGDKKDMGTPVLDLDQLIIFVTSACNLSCRTCFCTDHLNQKEDMSLEQIKILADSVRSFKHVLLTGGEPFLRDDLIDILKLFLRRTDVTINTNGLIPGRVRDVLGGVMSLGLPGHLVVGVSVDGFEKTHNQICGNNRAFEKALDTLRVVEGLQKTYQNLHLNVNTIITPDNLSELLPLAEEFAQGFSLEHHNFKFTSSIMKCNA